MRTTVKLDDDVAAAVTRLRREQGLGLSEALNRLVRAGLLNQATRKRFRQRNVRLALTVDVTNTAEALDLLDGPVAR